MSYMRTLAISCDRCKRWDDFGLIQPASAVEIRRAAKKNGWRRDGKDREARDLCPACIRQESHATIQRKERWYQIESAIVRDDVDFEIRTGRVKASTNVHWQDSSFFVRVPPGFDGCSEWGHKSRTKDRSAVADDPVEVFLSL